MAKEFDHRKCQGTVTGRVAIHAPEMQHLVPKTFPRRNVVTETDFASLELRMLALMEAE